MPKPKPTMLLPGKVKVQDWMSDFEISKTKTLAAKDYILEWFQKRIPSRRGGVPVIKAKSASDRIMVLRSGTGSGKSTTLGPELYKRFYEATKKNIAVTQPRVLTATSIPLEIVKYYPEMKLGETIGYQTGAYIYKPNKGVVFMTDGVLAQQLKVMSDEEFMEKYAFIVIDECHNRTLSMEFLLSMIKQLIHRNYKSRECPFLILTSATFDVKKYADYFMVDHKNIIDVEGLNYPIEVNFKDVPVSNYVAETVRKCLEIHTKNTDDYKTRFADILVFVAGSRQIKDIRAALDIENVKMKDGNYFVTIGLNRDSFQKGNIDYQNVFKPLSSISVLLSNGNVVVPKRRVIVSTNIAETGVTIDTLKYLIDTGFVYDAIFNPIYGSFSVIMKNVTKASSLQRKGRVGRRFPGVWYPMYTKEAFDEMNEDAHPDLITTDISEPLLGLIIKSVYPDWDGTISDDFTATGKFDVHLIDLLDYPSIDSIMHAMEKLYVLGMIDCSYTPTIMGLISARIIKVDMESIRMIIAGYQYGACIMDLITIAAFMHIGKRNFKNTRSKNKYNYSTLFKKNEESLKYYNKFFIADDFIETVFIWEDFMDQIEIMKKKLSINHVKNWAEENGILYLGLLQVIEQRDALLEVLIQSVGLDPYYNGLGIKKDKYSLRNIMQINISGGMKEIRKLKRCIYEGFRLNTASWNDERRSYILDTTHEKIKVKSDIIQPLPEHNSFVQTRPKKIIVRNIDLREGFSGELYHFECDTISVMDGYMDVDETFNMS